MARLFRGRNTAKVQPIAGKCGLPADSSAHVKEEEALPGSHTFGLNLCVWITDIMTCGFTPHHSKASKRCVE